MLQRHKLEVRKLHRRPHHPILLQRRPIALLQLCPWVRTLHDRHAAQKAEQIRRGKHGLIRGHARDDLEVRTTWDADGALEEAEPHGRCGSENAATVNRHAAGSRVVLVGETTLLNGLLGHGVAGREENGGCEGLGQDRARGQFGLVPGSIVCEIIVRLVMKRSNLAYQRNIMTGFFVLGDYWRCLWRM